MRWALVACLPELTSLRWAQQKGPGEGIGEERVVELLGRGEAPPVKALQMV